MIRYKQLDLPQTKKAINQNIDIIYLSPELFQVYFCSWVAGNKC